MRVILGRLGEGAWLAGPVAVCISTILLVAHATHRPPSLPGSVLFLCGVVSAYSLDHWADQPTQRSRRLLILAGVAAGLGFAATLWLPLWKISLALALGGAGLTYRQCKQWPLAKTILVAGGWTTAAAAFPVQWDAHNLFFSPLGGALLALFAANALLCDLKDGPADAQAGIPTVVVLWGPRATTRAATLLAVGGMMVALATERLGLAVAGLTLCVLATFPKVVARPVLGPALADGALTLPAALILLGLV